MGEINSATGTHNAPPQLVIIGQIIRQRGEAANPLQHRRRHGHDRPQREIDRPQAARLQDLAPKIGIDGDGLPAHGGVGGIGQPVKTVDKTGPRLGQHRRDPGRKIARHFHIGVADHDEGMGNERFQLAQGGDLAVRPQVLRANDQPRVLAHALGQQFPHEGADRIIGRGHAAEDLHGTGILLREPALQTAPGFCIATLERLEDGEAGQAVRARQASVQRKTFRNNPAPDGQYQAQHREDGKNQVRHG